MPNLVEIIIRAKDDTKSGFAAASASSASLSTKLQKIGMIGGAALGAVGVASVVMAAKFDSSMTTLQTQAGVSKSKLAFLEQGVLNLAGKVGFSPDSLAASAYHVASNMQSMGATGTKMLNAVKVAAEGAAVGHANLVDVTNALTAAIASGIPGAQNFTQAMGELNKVVGSGDMTMQDLADAFGSGMVATVKGFGLSLKDVGAALATFGDNNIRGAHAGTLLRMSVMALASATKPGIAILQQWGMSQNQLAKDMQHGGLLPALEDLMRHMRAAGVTAKEQGMYITNIFGKKAGAGLNVLLDQMDRLKSKYPELSRAGNQFGQAWAATQQTLSQRFKEVESNVQALGIELGNKLMPIAQALFGYLASHSKVVTDLAIAIGGLVGALTAMGLALKAISVVQDAIKAVKGLAIAMGLLSVAETEEGTALTFATGGLSLIIPLIAALAVGIYEAYKHSKTFRDIVASVGHALVVAFGGVKQAVGDVVNWVKGHWKILAGILLALTGPVGIVVALIISQFGQLKNIAGTVARAFDAVKNTITGGFDSWWKTHGEEVKTVWNAVWTGISTNFKVQWAAISGTFRMAWDLIGPVLVAGLAFMKFTWEATWSAVVAAFRVAWAVIGAVFRVAWGLFAATAKVIWDTIVGVFSVFLDLITGHWHRALDDIKNMGTQTWNAIRSFLIQTWNAIKNAAVSTWHAIGALLAQFNNDARKLLFGAGENLIKGLINGVKSMLGTLKSTVTGISHDVIGAFKSVFGIASPSKVTYNLGLMLGGGLENGLKAGQPFVVRAARNLGHSATTTLASSLPPGLALKLGGDLGNGVVSGLRARQAAVAAAAANLGHVAVAALESSLPPGLAAKLGGDIANGVPVGLKGAAGNAVKAASDTGNAVTSTLANALGGGGGGGGGGGSGSSGASKVKTAANSLISTVTSALSNLTGTAAQIASSIHTIMDAIRREFLSGGITGAQDSALVRWVSADNRKLTGLANQRAAIAATIAAAQSFQTGLQSSLGGTATITGAASAASAAAQAAAQAAYNQASAAASAAGLPAPTAPSSTPPPPTASGILSSLQSSLAAIRVFGSNIKRLAKLGLNKVMLGQIIQAGPVQGSQIAQAILDAVGPATSGGTNPGGPLGGGATHGPPSIISQLNSTQNAISKATLSISQSATADMYGAGVGAGKGFLKGLKEQEKSITEEMKHIADELVKRIRRDLRIHSPSGVMYDHGLAAAQGFTDGLNAGGPMVTAAAAALAAAAGGGLVKGGGHGWMPPISAGGHPFTPGGSMIPAGVGGRVGGGGTGPPVNAGGGVHITLELGSTFRDAGLSEQQLKDIRHTVRTRGGGNAQKAFGQAGH